MTVFKKPDPDVIAQLRAAYPKGAPRIDYREMTLRVDKPADDPDAAEAGGEGDVEAKTGRAAADNPLIPVAMSSEAPVLRYDWWDDEYYYEVLDHSASSVDLSYARDGMPFVASHRSWDADQQHGIVQDIAVKNKQLHGNVLASRAQRSQEIAQDMRDGIRKKVSIGYVVGDEYDQTEKAKDGIPIRRYMDWMPIEMSTVPIPADYTVGVGRAASADGRAALARFLTLHPAPSRSAAAAAPAREQPPLPQAAPKAEERTMKDDNAAPAAGGTPGTDVVGQPTITVKEMRDNEKLRMDNIHAMARSGGIDKDKVAEWIATGRSELEVVKEINTILTERMNKPIKTVNGPDLNAKEMRRFSFARALMLNTPLESECRKEAGGSKIDFGFEREVIAESARIQGGHTSGQQGGGTIMPYNLFGRAGVDSATSTTGGPFKFTEPGPFIPVLRNKTSVMRAGSTILSGLTGPVTFPKQTAPASSSYMQENPGSGVAISNLLTTTLTLSFKSLAAATAFSRQVLFSAASGNYDMEAIVQGDMLAVVGLAIDLGSLSCTDGNGPRGILQNSNIGSVFAGNGTNGGTAVWATYVALETAIGDANADSSRMAYITNTKQRGVAKNQAVLGSTNSAVPIWTGPYPATPGGPTADGVATPMDGIVNGYRAIASNQVPRNLTKGSDTTSCSAILFGAWEHNLIGMFGAGYETIVDPYSSKLKGMVEVVTWVFFDSNQRYDQAFAAAQDAK